jgi:hypothetical protein
MRGALMAGFFASASVGSVLGVMLGGIIAAHWGWKAAFGVVGFPGLVLALLYLFVRDYRTVELTPRLEKATRSTRAAASHIVRVLTRSRTMLWMCVGAPAQGDRDLGRVVVVAELSEPGARHDPAGRRSQGGTGGPVRRARQRRLGHAGRPRGADASGHQAEDGRAAVPGGRCSSSAPRSARHSSASRSRRRRSSRSSRSAAS